jgi:hypothetical protein
MRLGSAPVKGDVAFSHKDPLVKSDCPKEVQLEDDQNTQGPCHPLNVGMKLPDTAL